MPDTGETYDSAVDALKKHFMPKVNVVVERHTFRKRVQASHENIQQYVAALHALAANCDFGDKVDDMIRDQLLEHLHSDDIRQRLLLEPDLTLQKATTLATQLEAATEHARRMTADRDAPVRAVQVKPHYARGKHRPTSRPTTAPASSTRKSCFRCGSDRHLANSSQCPAAKVFCKLCNKKGHFARVCRSASANDVREVQVHDVTVLYLENSAEVPKKLHCEVTVNTPASPGTTVQFVVDTGSSVSILPLHIYKHHFSATRLSTPAIRLVTYTQEYIPVLGCLQAQACVSNASAAATFFVVDKGTALLGMDLISALQLQINGDNVCTSVMATNTTSLTDTEIGCVKNFIHKAKIDPTVKPVRQKLRRLPFAVRASVSAELDRLLKAGVIERVDASAWVSPIVVTGKKTGGIRMCADLREVNKAVITDCYPLPHIDEMLTSLRGATVFSTIDLANAYYQLPLHEDCRDITAFITHDGLFRYCRVPYGLASAPSAFQKMMATILEGIPGVKNYLDDVIVYGETAEDHDLNLSTVLQKLKQSGLVLNDKKCNFKQTSLRFLGHVINANGILPDREHLDAVREAPPPSDAAALQSFLGLVSWYSKFLPGFATVVAPMRECAKEKGQFSWTPAAQSSFEDVKQMLVSSPALAIYDPTLHSVISTDASDYGLGAVFAQIQSDGTEKPVAFASRTLTDAEKKYSIVEKEAMACVWATEKWRTYVWGHRFTLRTDHQALTTLLTTKGMGRAGMRIARWAARLLCFDYNVVYRPGSQNHTADCLSRLPIPAPADSSADLESEIVALISSTLCSLSVTEFENACAACPEMEMLRKKITHGWSPSIKTVSQDMIPYFRVRDELAVKDAFIFRGTRLLVPVALRHTLIALAHESHQGVVRTKQRLRDLYWWPQMDSQVQSAIATCIPCQSNDKSAVTHPAPLQPVQFPDGPWKKLGLDIVGPFETATPACRYAITLTDYHSKWPELAFASSATTEDVLKFLSTVFSRHGNPEAIVTDNGTQFTSAAFAEFLKERDINHNRTSVYYPASNGAVERLHRVLKGCIQTAIQHSHPWNRAVTEWLQVYRATPHATTGVSPYELLYGRKMRTKLNILPLHAEGKCDLAAVRENVKKKQDKMKLYTDHKRGARNPLFGVGGRVRIRLPRATPKGHPRFSAPVRVEKRVGPNTFLLSDGKKWNAAHLAYSPGLTDCARNTLQQTHNTTHSSVKTSRMRRKPVWHKDYEVH